MFSHRSYPNKAPNKDDVQVIKVSKKVGYMGNFSDVDGVRWNIMGVIHGFHYVARVNQMDPHYSSTTISDGGFHQQSWEPAIIEVVEEKG